MPSSPKWSSPTKLEHSQSNLEKGPTTTHINDAPPPPPPPSPYSTSTPKGIRTISPETASRQRKGLFGTPPHDMGSMMSGVQGKPIRPIQENSTSMSSPAFQTPRSHRSSGSASSSRYNTPRAQPHSSPSRQSRLRPILPRSSHRSHSASPTRSSLRNPKPSSNPSTGRRSTSRGGKRKSRKTRKSNKK